MPTTPALTGNTVAPTTAPQTNNNPGTTGNQDNGLSFNAPQQQQDANSEDQAVANQASSGMDQFNKNALALPNMAAYNPQGAQQNLNNIAAGASLGQVANNGQVANTQIPGSASTYNAAGIAPLLALNGAQVSTGVQNQNAAAQQAAINNLNNIAQGNGPNAATIAAKQQAQQNSAAQMAAIASAGGNPALAARNAAQAATTANQQGAANAVLGSAQEQLGAQGTLQSALSSITQSGQAIPLAQAQLNASQQAQNQSLQNTNAQQNAAAQNTAAGTNAAAQNALLSQQGSMNQQTNLANQQALIQSTGLNAQQYNAMLGAQLQQTSYDTSQAENAQNAYQQAQESLAGIAAGQGIASQNNATQVIGSGIGAVGAGAAGAASLIPSATSDRRAKMNIKPATRDLNKFFKSLNVKAPQQFNLGTR
jgi:hypothetical protein